MEEATINVAAFSYSQSNWERQIKQEYSIHQVNQEAFLAGAQWQKEQLKYLINAATNAANTCEDCGDMITAEILRKEIEKFNS